MTGPVEWNSHLYPIQLLGRSVTVTSLLIWQLPVYCKTCHIPFWKLLEPHYLMQVVIQSHSRKKKKKKWSQQCHLILEMLWRIQSRGAHRPIGNTCHGKNLHTRVPAKFHESFHCFECKTIQRYLSATAIIKLKVLTHVHCQTTTDKRETTKL